MDRSRLLYVGDPMCSWCWGFSPVMKQIADDYQDKFSLDVCVGGLRPTDEVVVDEEMRKFLLHHWREVEKRSGQAFDYSILDTLGWIYNTEPACRAVLSARVLYGSRRALGFFEHLQQAYYQQGEIITTNDVIERLAISFGLTGSEFRETYLSKAVETETLNEFQSMRAIGINGFPTLLFIHNEQPHLVAQGYSSLESITQRIENILD